MNNRLPYIEMHEATKHVQDYAYVTSASDDDDSWLRKIILEALSQFHIFCLCLLCKQNNYSYRPPPPPSKMLMQYLNRDLFIHASYMKSWSF